MMINELFTKEVLMQYAKLVQLLRLGLRGRDRKELCSISYYNHVVPAFGKMYKGLSQTLPV